MLGRLFDDTHIGLSLHRDSIPAVNATGKLLDTVSIKFVKIYQLSIWLVGWGLTAL